MSPVYFRSKYGSKRLSSPGITRKLCSTFIHSKFWWNKDSSELRATNPFSSFSLDNMYFWFSFYFQNVMTSQRNSWMQVGIFLFRIWNIQTVRNNMKTYTSRFPHSMVKRRRKDSLTTIVVKNLFRTTLQIKISSINEKRFITSKIWLYFSFEARKRV